MSSNNNTARVLANSTYQCFLVLLFAQIAMLALAGCRSANGVQVDVMERELRQQENYIYELEDYLVEYSDKLRKCRCAHQNTTVDSSTVRKQSSSTSVPTLAEDDLSDDDLDFSSEPEDTANSSMSEKSEPEVVSESDLPEPTTETDATQSLPNAVEETPFEDLQVPDLEIEEPSAFRQDVSPLIASTTAAEIAPANKGPLFIPDPAEFQPESYRSRDSTALQNAILENETQETDMTDEAGEYYEHTVDRLEDDVLDSQTNDIDRIVIQHLFRGTLQDEFPNDEGMGRRDSQRELSFEEALFAKNLSENSLPTSLLAVVEVRDQLNEPVEANGPVSLMVMAIGSDLKARRIQRWDFTEEEVNASWQSSQYGDGLHLEMPLDQQSLPDEQLELWARLVSADREKYLTKLPFDPQELVAFGDEPVLSTEIVETRITARSGRETNQFERSSDLIDSSSHQLLTPSSQWRASMETATRRSYSASNAVKGANRSVRWSAQSSGGRFGQSSSVVAPTSAPKLQSRYAKSNIRSTLTNDSTVWKTVPPTR